MERVKIVAFEWRGLVVKQLWPRRETFTVTYGEILTVERDQRHRLVLHTRTAGELLVRGDSGPKLEDALRRRGVRIVDCWGAIIAPTVADFAEALAQKPPHMRQSSDSAGGESHQRG